MHYVRAVQLFSATYFSLFMRQKGFRQNFTQSFATLPLVALVTAAVWIPT